MTTGLLGAACGVGLLMVAVGIARPPSPTQFPRPRGGVPRHRYEPASVALPLGLAVMSATVMFLLTGWFVGAGLAGLAAAVLPRAMADAAAPRALVQRAEAVATWAEMLRDTMAAAAGLEEAIVSTAPVAPLAIRAEVQHLATRLERDRLRPALEEFAATLSDPAADLVVAALLLASEHHARDLGALLGALAGSARMEASMVLRVEAGRSRLRTAARVVTVTTVGFALLLVLFNRAFLEPYDDGLGQAWLLVVGTLFAIGIRELGRMARLVAPPRLLAGS